jgi:hypothetical protein
MKDEGIFLLNRPSTSQDEDIYLAGKYKKRTFLSNSGRVHTRPLFFHPSLLPSSLYSLFSSFHALSLFFPNRQ